MGIYNMFEFQIICQSKHIYSNRQLFYRYFSTTFFILWKFY